MYLLYNTKECPLLYTLSLTLKLFFSYFLLLMEHSNSWCGRTKIVWLNSLGHNNFSCLKNSETRGMLIIIFSDITSGTKLSFSIRRVTINGTRSSSDRITHDHFGITPWGRHGHKRDVLSSYPQSLTPHKKQYSDLHVKGYFAYKISGVYSEIFTVNFPMYVVFQFTSLLTSPPEIKGGTVGYPIIIFIVVRRKVSLSF